MGLQQFERRLERMVEGVFARAFRSGLQPVEVGRRLTREMDLRRTVAPRGTLTPNQFSVLLAPADRERFSAIEDELVDELVAAAEDHAHNQGYLFIGPVTVTIDTDEDLSPGMMLIAGELVRGEQSRANLIMPDGRRIPLDTETVTVGRLPECTVALADPNVSRQHAQIAPAPRSDGTGRFRVSDLGSTNGTKVNGIPVVDSQVLRDGDQLTIGATVIRFEQQ